MFPVHVVSPPKSLTADVSFFQVETVVHAATEFILFLVRSRPFLFRVYRAKQRGLFILRHVLKLT